MEKLFKQLLESAKKNKAGMKALKHATLLCQNYELASQLREIEKRAFPETKEHQAAKNEAIALNTTFRMVGLEIPEAACWLILKAVEGYKKKKGNFSQNDAAKITAKQAEIFDN